MNNFNGFTLAGVKASNGYKLVWAAEIVEMYAEHLRERIEKESLDSEDLDEINEELECAKIVSEYMYKLSDEVRTENELENLVNELNK